MHPDTIKLLLTTLESQVRQTKAAYYSAVPGVTYDDMAAAARRLLEMRAVVERATGRKVTSKPTSLAVATLLRSI